VAQTFVEVWEGVSSLIAELDVLVGFADLTVSSPSPYVRPTMLPAESGEITLVGSRHPCVEAQVPDLAMILIDLENAIINPVNVQLSTMSLHSLSP
jgi:DNA mismatch repair ATPase MutS